MKIWNKNTEYVGILFIFKILWCWIYIGPKMLKL